jgi:hypothetical protein
MGPAGALGATGPMGPKGDTGPQGAPGATGPLGPTGPSGSSVVGGSAPGCAFGGVSYTLSNVTSEICSGAPGPAGPAGATGSVGPTGGAGPAGPSGATGATGPAGLGLSKAGMYVATASTGINGFVTARCNDTNDVVVGGGCNADQSAIFRSYPVDVNNAGAKSGWYCSSASFALTAYAVCATVP